jgi:hypothetical protein
LKSIIIKFCNRMDGVALYIHVTSWIGNVLRRNCLLRHVTEGKVDGRIEATERRGRIRKKLLDDLEETRECWKLKEVTLCRSL